MGKQTYKASIQISRRTASEQQIDDAISLLFKDRIPSAVTLAGAVESALEECPEPNESLFYLMKTQGEKRTGLSNKAVIDNHLNKLRNWLKHNNSTDFYVDVMQEDGVIMILRAYTKFTSVYGVAATTPIMKEFESWFRKHYGHWLQSSE